MVEHSDVAIALRSAQTSKSWRDRTTISAIALIILHEVYGVDPLE
ncbi:MAG: hypothetical protein ACHBN1_31585 [Heteroscytonema crispum UTEX LB 1556]